MKQVGLSGEYIFWMKDDFIYKYLLTLFLPVYIFHLLLWYLFFFLEQGILSILVYCVCFIFSLVRLFSVSGRPKGRSVVTPFFICLLLLVLSLFVLLVCVFPKVNGVYSEFFWSDEKYKPLSWSFLMSGGFGLVYIGIGYLRAAYLNFKEEHNV